MKNIVVMSRAKAVEYVNNIQEKCIVISIDTDGVKNHFNENQNVLDILYCTMQDEESGDGAMTPQQASLIADFVNLHLNEINTVIVHCDAGVSRSAGVGAAFMACLNGDDSPIFDSPKYCPNMHCYRLIMNAMNCFVDDRQLKDKENRSIEVWKDCMEREENA